MKASTSASRDLCRTLMASATIVAGIFAVAAQLGARVPPTALDQKLMEQNPRLYEAARVYFPNDDSDAPPQRIFRLTRDQLDATVTALLPGYVERSVKATMARDPLQTNYEYADLLSINQANLGPLAKWIGEIAKRVRARPEDVVDCASTSNSPDCLKSKARAFAIKAFRGDVEDRQLDRIAGFYSKGVASAGFAQATGDLVEVVLNSPSFLYRKDANVDEAALATLAAPERERIISARLLQALTFTMADVLPDKLGLDAAAPEKYFKTGEETRATIARIASARETREKLVRFFKAWLEVKEPSEFTISSEIFPEFKPPVAAAMVEEADRFLRAELSKPNPNLKDITRAKQSYIPKALEPIYAVKVADASGTKPVQLDPSQRLGIFSLPAVLASHSGPTSSRPIKRGVFWVRKVMCMEMEQPSKEVLAEIEQNYAPVTTTERARIEQATRPAVCIGCHKVIDPFGFFLESYDALGRWRTSENGHPIDPKIGIDFLDESSAGPIKTDSAVKALETLTGSLMFKQCFVRQMFRYYTGRNEEPSDEPLLRRMFFEFANNDRQEILDPLRLLSLSDRIVQR